jgi:hypothetical protein
MGAGQIVSQQAWEKFLSEVVMSRFPAGLTVLEALGKGTTTVGQLTRTRVLIVVHPSGRDAEARLTEIKAEYKRRFGPAGIFHMDQLVQVRAQQPRNWDRRLPLHYGGPRRRGALCIEGIDPTIGSLMLAASRRRGCRVIEAKGR